MTFFAPERGQEVRSLLAENLQGVVSLRLIRTADGSHVRGSRDRDREYSEYWTLIRGAGVKGAPRGDKSCPNCGAPLDVNMAGQCEHCGAKITSGEFVCKGPCVGGREAKASSVASTARAYPG
mgnify:CR=1 FL=1